MIGRQLGLNTEIQDRKISLRSDAFHVDVLLGENLDISSINVDNQGDMLVRTMHYVPRQVKMRKNL